MQNYTSELLYGTSRVLYSYRVVTNNLIVTAEEPNATLTVYDTDGTVVIDSQALSFDDTTGIASANLDISDTSKFPASTLPNWRYNFEVRLEPVTGLVFKRKHWLAIVHEPWEPNVTVDDIKAMCNSMDLDDSSDDDYLVMLQRAEDDLRILFVNEDLPVGMFKQKPLLDNFVKVTAIANVWMSRQQGEGTETYATYAKWANESKAVKQTLLEAVKYQVTNTNDANDLIEKNWSMGRLEL